METTKQETGREGSERRRYDGAERRVRERRAFDPSGRRLQERRSSIGPAKREQSSIGNLCVEHRSLSAFIENQIVLGRCPQDIAQGIGVRFGLRVSGAAVAAYRNNLAWTETGAVERIFEESREAIGRLIDEMEIDGGVQPRGIGTIAAIWQRVRRWLAGIGHRDQGTEGIGTRD